MYRNPNGLVRRALWPLLLGLWWLTSCVASLPREDGEATVSLDVSDGTTTDVIYDPLLGQIRVSPPIDGVVEIVFRNDDPYVEVRIRVDGAVVQDGEVVSLPADAASPNLQIAVEDGTFTSDSVGSSGALTFETLRIEEDYADLDIRFDVTLGELNGDRILQARGRVASRYGEPAEGNDGGTGPEATE